MIRIGQKTYNCMVSKFFKKGSKFYEVKNMIILKLESKMEEFPGKKCERV